MESHDRASWRIARVAGVPVLVHSTTLLLLVGLPLGLGLARGPGVGLRTAVIVLLALGAVLAHELAHALVALREGLRVGSVRIGPLWNAATVEEPRRPDQEWRVAAAGPLANLLLAGLSMLLRALSSGPAEQLLLLGAGIQAAMGLGNLLPLYPLDGARILRGLLGRRLRWTPANHAAVAIGLLVLAVVASSAWFWLPQDISLRLALLLGVLALLGGTRWQILQTRAREWELQEAASTTEGEWRGLAPEAFERHRKKCESAHRRRRGLSFLD